LVGRSGFTIIELIIVIAVLGIAIPPLLSSISETLESNIKVRTTQTASILGRGLMEEILSKQYDLSTSSPWSNPLGAGVGETRATYNDVDDFDGFSENPISGFTGYSSSVSVYYVDPDTTGLDTAKPDSSNTLDYKRVDVTITHPLTGSLRFSTIVSRSRTP
jgi:MSHA pilin protein MshD